MSGVTATWLRRKFTFGCHDRLMIAASLVVNSKLRKKPLGNSQRNEGGRLGHCEARS